MYFEKVLYDKHNKVVHQHVMKGSRLFSSFFRNKNLESVCICNYLTLLQISSFRSNQISLLLVATYLLRLAAGLAVRGSSTKYSLVLLDTNACRTFSDFLCKKIYVHFLQFQSQATLLHLLHLRTMNEVLYSLCFYNVVDVVTTATL